MDIIQILNEKRRIRKINEAKDLTERGLIKPADLTRLGALLKKANVITYKKKEYDKAYFSTTKKSRLTVMI